MKARIVIGANYGDEGKGTVVASYVKKAKGGGVLNVLTNGGSQRGHSILTKDGSITFQHFGSGTYHGADSYYSRFFILNPMQFVQEYEALIVKPTYIYRDRDCLWSTPYDVMANLISEEQRKRQCSCGMGIWNTIKRYKSIGITFDEFMDRDDVGRLSYLGRVKNYYEKSMEISSHWKKTWDDLNIAFHFMSDCEFMYKYTFPCDISSLSYENVIFENGQGLLLCDTGKDTPDTTPSDTGITYALEMAKKIGIQDITAHYVTRPYLTRHGDGHLAGEVSRLSVASTVQEDRTNHYNNSQGAFRYGILDINSLRDRIIKDARGIPFEVEVTHCDEMDREKEFKKEFSDVNFISSPLV